MWHSGTILMEILTAVIVIVFLSKGVISLKKNFSQAKASIILSA